MLILALALQAAQGGVYAWCTAAEKSIAGLACTSFVNGAIGGALEVNRMQGSPPPFCISKAVSQRGKETIVVAYLEKHLEYKNHDSASIVVAAMHDAFPCTR